MATTQAELDAIKAARNRGVLRWSYDGRTLEYRSLEEMDRIIGRMERELGSGAVPLRTATARVTKGICA